MGMDMGMTCRMDMMDGVHMTCSMRISKTSCKGAFLLHGGDIGVKGVGGMFTDGYVVYLCEM